MVSKYKVIRRFGNARPEDIFEWDGDNYTMKSEESKQGWKQYRSMSIDMKTAQSYSRTGLLQIADPLNFKPIVTKESVAEVKLNTLKSSIEKLESIYKEDLRNVLEGYNNGQVQGCVKVEAETVYYNLQKLIDHIKTIINE